MSPSWGRVRGREFLAALKPERRDACNFVRVDLSVVLRFVTQSPARLEVPPSPCVLGCAVDDRKTEVRRGQAGAHEPSQVARRKPDRQVSLVDRLGAGAADPKARHAEPELVV